MTETTASTKDYLSRVARQAWFGLAFWIAFGLLVEGLIGFRSPSYLQDSVRREVFRLAHAHGTVLHLLFLIAVYFVRAGISSPPSAALWSLRLGVLLMPLGFLLGGIWHYESEPGVGIFLSPLGGVMILFAVIAFAFSTSRVSQQNK
jgi:hypothetical protein